MAVPARARHFSSVIVFRSAGAMKHGAWLLIFLGTAAASGAHEIHKCIDDGAVSYQNAPCSDGQVQARVPKLPDYADPPERDAATAPASASSEAPQASGAAPTRDRYAAVGRFLLKRP